MWPKFALILSLGAAVYCAAQWYEGKVLYAPDPVLLATPAKIGLAFESVTFDSAGTDISSWFVPASESNRPAILFLHGRAGNLSHCLQKIRFFNALGFNVFAVDYRGYGESGGSPTQTGLQRDAVSAYFHLTGVRSIPAERIFAYGESLGAAVAVDLAARVRLAGVILEAPFTSAADVLSAVRPKIPWDVLLRDKYDSLSKVRDMGTPVLFIHSADDEQVPFRHSQKLFAAAREPKKLLKVRGAHNNALLNSFEEFCDEVAGFVEEHAGKPVEQQAGRLGQTTQ